MARRGVIDAIMSKKEYTQPEQGKVSVKLALSILDPDELIECLYNKVHRIMSSPFINHDSFTWRFSTVIPRH